MSLVPRDGDLRLAIDWPGLGDEPIFRSVNENLKRATEPLGGEFVENPLWRLDYLGKNLTTVHPLGGCCIGRDASVGVVDHRGRVFAGASGTAVHDGLYVCDGAVLPVPVGVNPLLTISALAERSMVLLAEEKGWTIDFGPGAGTARAPAVAPPIATVTAPPSPARPGADFQEQWYGTLDGDGGELSLRFVVNARDLTALLSDPSYRAPVFGSAARFVDTKTTGFAIKGGWLSVDGAAIRYHLPLEWGKLRLLAEGARDVPGGPSLDAIAAVARLRVTLSTENGKKTIAGGVLNVKPDEHRRDLASIRIYNSSTVADRLAKTLTLGRLLAGPLYDVHGAVSRSAPRAMAPGRVRKRRSMRAPAAAVQYFAAPDGTLLRLERRQPANDRGPVLLFAGVGESSRLFSLDSVGRTLVEFLAGNGFDTWVLDHRGSLEAPRAEDYDLDQVAELDLPAALALIAATTASKPVQLVGYGMGAAAAFMAVLGGKAPQVSSLVALEVGCFIDASTPAQGCRRPRYLSAGGLRNGGRRGDRKAHLRLALRRGQRRPAQCRGGGGAGREATFGRRPTGAGDLPRRADRELAGRGRLPGRDRADQDSGHPRRGGGGSVPPSFGRREDRQLAAHAGPRWAPPVRGRARLWRNGPAGW